VLLKSSTKDLKDLKILFSLNVFKNSKNKSLNKLIIKGQNEAEHTW